MPKINKHIEIVSSSIAGLSSMSEKSRLTIQQSLAKSYKTVGITLVDSEADLTTLIENKPDIVFLGMACVPRKPTPSNSHPQIWLADELHKNNIPYSGSGTDAMVLESDKLKAKKVIKKAGLSTAPFFMAYTGQFTSESQLVLDFPMFVKPPKLGAGVGVDKYSVVRNYREYKTKIAKLDKDLDSEALVETYLTGREFTVAILENESPVLNPETNELEASYQVMPLELIAPVNSNGDSIIGSKVKSSDSEKASLISDPSLKQEISDLAINCFKLLGAKNFGRIDIRCDENGVGYFMEANLIPSLIEDYGNFQKACSLNNKISYDKMLLRIVDLGFKGYTPYVAPLPPEPKPVLATVR